MPIGSVVLTPGSAYSVGASPVLDLSGEAVADSDWTARVSIQIAAADQQGVIEPPLLLVLTGPASAYAPYLGFAQRSARRAVGGYVLVDPVLPKPGAVGDWPDAPVTVVVTPDADDTMRSAALGARLRGWEVVDGDAGDAIASIAQRP